MKIAFIDFWPSFNPSNNFIIHLFKGLFENVELTNPSNCDCLIYSWFGNNNKNYNNCKRIFFAGENKKPNFEECDYSFTNVFDSYEGKNIRLPLWYFYVDWFGVKSYGDPDWLIPMDYLLNENQFSKKEKEKFCCSVFSNPESKRVQMVETVRKYKNVDCFGKCNEMQIPQKQNHGGYYEKLDVISKYKFSICFENAIEPGGFYTEKLLHSKIAGNIPVYYSDKRFSEDFNEKCCLNLINYSSMDDLLEDIIKIDNDKNEYNKILSEPLFINIPCLDDIQKKIYNLDLI